MIDHITFAVNDYEVSKTFYKKVLPTLGYELIIEVAGFAGFGANGKPEFWFYQATHPIAPFHIAFRSDTRKQVDAFYQAALAAGAKDNGPPGIRTLYHPNYYGAFILDLDGYNIEAVCHHAE